MEAANKDTKSFKMVDLVMKKIGSCPQNAADKNCYCCGSSNHIPVNCKFKDTKCLKYRKIGHIVPTCQTSRCKQPHTPRQKQKTHHIEADAQSPDHADSSNSDQFKLN